MKILVADDDEILRKLFKRCLNEAGHVCRTAQDGNACLEQLKTETFDLIYLDLIMPGMSKGSVVEIHKANPTAKIVIISTLDDETAMKAVFAEGAIAFMRKPFDVDMIMKTTTEIEFSIS